MTVKRTFADKQHKSNHPSNPHVAHDANDQNRRVAYGDDEVDTFGGLTYDDFFKAVIFRRRIRLHYRLATKRQAVEESDGVIDIVAYD